MTIATIIKFNLLLKSNYDTTNNFKQYLKSLDNEKQI